MIKSLLLRKKCVSNHKFIFSFKFLISNQTNMINFCTLEGVDCGSETQIQVGENLNGQKDESASVETKRIKQAPMFGGFDNIALMS